VRDVKGLAVEVSNDEFGEELLVSADGDSTFNVTPQELRKTLLQRAREAKVERL
jgi:hypothetical protein